MSWSKELVGILGVGLALLAFGWQAVQDLRGDLTAEMQSIRVEIRAVDDRVRQNGEAIAELTGLVRGLHKLDLAEDR